MFPRTAFPAYGNGDWAVFTPPPNATTTNSWQPWRKPPGCNMVYMFMQAAGGIGGAGAGPTGGGGGGSGGSSRLLIPAIFLPDVLYLRVGRGGVTTGLAGQSFISTRPETTTAFLVMTQAGGGSGAGSAGPAGAIGTASAAVMQNAGIWVSVAGQIGGAPGSAAPGSSITPFGSGVLTTGGAGGGSTGGSINAAGWLTQTIPGGASGVAGANGIGVNTLLTPQLVFSGMQPLLFTGGAGGGGTGAGGAAGYGGGGGGGGDSTGPLGPGGDGFILMGAF